MNLKEEFINIEINKSYMYNDILHLINKLLNNEKVIFTKFGDGEYLCMNLQNIGNNNCDYDKYTYELGINLKHAFCNLCNRSDSENIYIGKWHTQDVISFYCNVLYDFYNINNIKIKSVPFVNYHFCYNDYNFNKNNNLFEFVKTIQNIDKIKIIISNNNNKNLSLIFNGTYYINIPNNSWFADGYYNFIENNLINILNKHNDAIIIIAGGLASKVLIANVSEKFNKASFIDIGSGFDILATKIDTRHWGNGHTDFINNFKNQYDYYKSILPDNYDII